jgi:hypothetical protein
MEEIREEIKTAKRKLSGIATDLQIKIYLARVLMKLQGQTRLLFTITLTHFV